MAIKIKKGVITDVDELTALYNNLNDYFTVHTNSPGWIKGIYPTRETAQQGINSDCLFVARTGKKIVGSIILNHAPEEAYHQAQWQTTIDYHEVLVVRTLVVSPSMMKKKIATALLNFAKQYAVSQLCKSIRLDVSVHNTPAIALYEKLGYVYIDTVDLNLPYEHLKWFKLYELVV